MGITIRKIAKDLKLAVSTVSKALRDSHEISEETKRRVFDHARKLQYIPNPYAGSLKNRTTRNIAVVIPEVADTFFSNAINGVESVAQAEGYHVMVYLTHERSEREASILQELRSGRVDGILISVSGGVAHDSLIHAQVAKELPLIFFDRVCDEVPAARVVTDDFEASYKATSHLVSKGCKEIVFLATAASLSITDQRRNGFIKALADHHIDDGHLQVLQCSENEHESLDIIQQMLKGRKIDGVIGSVEKLAMQAYAACHACGLSIPRDVRVIAFSNLQIASLLAPPLTTVVQPAFEMGKAAATLLFKALARKTDLSHEQVVLPSVLCERESSQ